MEKSFPSQVQQEFLQLPPVKKAVQRRYCRANSSNILDLDNRSYSGLSNHTHLQQRVLNGTDNMQILILFLCGQFYTILIQIASA